jgi:hypothetical protein
VQEAGSLVAAESAEPAGAGAGAATGAGAARGSSSNPTLIRLSSRRCGALGGPEAAVNVMRSENARHFIILWTAFALPS